MVVRALRVRTNPIQGDARIHEVATCLKFAKRAPGGASACTSQP